MPTKITPHQMTDAVAHIEAAQEAIKAALEALDYVQEGIGLADPAIASIMATLEGVAFEPATGKSYGNLDRVLGNMPTYLGLTETDIRRYVYLNLGQYYLADAAHPDLEATGKGQNGLVDAHTLLEDVFDYFELPRCIDAEVTINGISVIQMVLEALDAIEVKHSYE